MNVILSAIPAGKTPEKTGRRAWNAFGPVTGYFCMLTVAVFSLFTGAADAGEAAGEKRELSEDSWEALERIELEVTEEYWELYEHRVYGDSGDTVHGGDISYLVALDRHPGERSDELFRITFEFEFISADGLGILATVRGYSLTSLVPVSPAAGCYYTELYENYESSRSDYIICEEEDKFLLSKIDMQSSPVMPGHLVLTKVSKPASE